MSITPVIKWAGGKRQLVPTILPMMPATYGTYFEPFFGGGALFCELQPKVAVINDFNKQLIGMYRCIEQRPDEVCKAVKNLQGNYNSLPAMADKDAYYKCCRDLFNKEMQNGRDSVLAASLLIFLNKAGFNGLYRVNAKGLLNVPSAHRQTVNAFDSDNIKEWSKALKKATIMCGDFEIACNAAQAGDFVFFDSPYYDTFDTYQAGGFSEADHKRLFALFDRLAGQGVYCMLTNNSCDFIKNLYSGYNIKEVDVKRMINCNANARTGKEVIVTSY